MPSVLIVTGLLTMGAILAFLAPARILRLVFGIADASDGIWFLVRHWGLLVFLVGVLLVFAARHPAIQTPVMAVAATEKLVGSVLVLTSTLRRRLAALAVVAADSLMGLIYLGFLLR